MSTRRSSAWIISVVLIAFLAGPAAAEIEWEAGLKIGANGSRLTGDQVSLWITPPNWNIVAEVDDFKIGFTGGFYLLASLSDVFGIQCEVLYSQRGGKGPIRGRGPVQLPADAVTLGEIDGEIRLKIAIGKSAAFSFVHYSVDIVFGKVRL